LEAQMRNILGDYQLFQEGFGLAALVEEVTLPDLKWKAEDHTGGGLMGTRQMKTILEKMELKFKTSGYDPRAASAVGQMPGQTQNYKLMASFVVPGDGEVPQKILVTGAMTELKRDAYKASGKMMTEYTVNDVIYYEEWFDGKQKFLIDLLNQVFMVDGVDVMLQRRRNTGRA
jgi:uncharacterized protein